MIASNTPSSFATFSSNVVTKELAETPSSTEGSFLDDERNKILKDVCVELLFTLGSKATGYSSTDQLSSDFARDTGWIPDMIAYKLGFVNFEKLITSKEMECVVEIQRLDNDGKMLFLPKLGSKFKHIRDAQSVSEAYQLSREERNENEKISRALLKENLPNVIEGKKRIIEIVHELGGEERQITSWQNVQNKYLEKYGVNLASEELRRFFSRDKPFRILSTLCNEEFDLYETSKTGQICLKMRKPYEEILQTYKHVKELQEKAEGAKGKKRKPPPQVNGRSCPMIPIFNRIETNGVAADLSSASVLFQSSSSSLSSASTGSATTQQSVQINNNSDPTVTQPSNNGLGDSTTNIKNLPSSFLTPESSKSHQESIKDKFKLPKFIPQTENNSSAAASTKSVHFDLPGDDSSNQKSEIATNSHATSSNQQPLSPSGQQILWDQAVPVYNIDGDPILVSRISTATAVAPNQTTGEANNTKTKYTGRVTSAYYTDSEADSSDSDTEAGKQSNCQQMTRPKILQIPNNNAPSLPSNNRKNQTTDGRVNTDSSSDENDEDDNGGRRGITSKKQSSATGNTNSSSIFGNTESLNNILPERDANGIPAINNANSAILSHQRKHSSGTTSTVASLSHHPPVFDPAALSQQQTESADGLLSKPITPNLSLNSMSLSQKKSYLERYIASKNRNNPSGNVVSTSAASATTSVNSNSNSSSSVSMNQVDRLTINTTISDALGINSGQQHSTGTNIPTFEPQTNYPMLAGGISSISSLNAPKIVVTGGAHSDGIPTSAVSCSSSPSPPSATTTTNLLSNHLFNLLEHSSELSTMANMHRLDSEIRLAEGSFVFRDHSRTNKVLVLVDTGSDVRVFQYCQSFLMLEDRWPKSQCEWRFFAKAIRGHCTEFFGAGPILQSQR